MNSDENRDKFRRNALQVDAKLMHSDIATQEVPTHAAERSKEIAQASPHAFDGIGMDFKNIIIVIVPRPFFDAMSNS